MKRITMPPGGFRRTLLAISVPAFCVACTQPRVDYASVPNATPGQGDVPGFTDPGIRFRIPRSLITVSAQKPDPKAAAAPAATIAFADEAIDPIDTAGKTIGFKHNTGFSYGLKLIPDTAGVATREDFFGKIASGDMHILPAPQCVQALLTIWGPKQNGGAFAVAAVPSELEIPASIGAPSNTLSPLYAARPRNDLLSTTTLNVTYLGDTKIMQSVGSTVTDNTQAAIKTIASVATAAAGLAALAQPLHPATPAQVELATIPVLVADNRWVQPVMIPASGSVTFTTCGANVMTKTDATPPLIAAGADLATLMTQAKQVYSSIGK